MVGLNGDGSGDDYYCALVIEMATVVMVVL